MKTGKEIKEEMDRLKNQVETISELRIKHTAMFLKMTLEWVNGISPLSPSEIIVHLLKGM